MEPEPIPRFNLRERLVNRLTTRMPEYCVHRDAELAAQARFGKPFAKLGKDVRDKLYEECLEARYQLIRQG